MAVAKVALSLPEPLVTKIDRLAKKAGLSRSAFVRQAVQRTLQEPAETQSLRAVYKLYAEIGEADRELSEKFLPLATETLPSTSAAWDAGSAVSLQLDCGKWTEPPK
jgi:metal-responsive CopG/Arc/MetJ family transcriptional regulator